MRVDLTRLQKRAGLVFDRERLSDGKFGMVAFVCDAKGRVLSEGWNSYTKSHPVQQIAANRFGRDHKRFLHAEIHALARLGRKQLGRQDTLVVFRLTADKSLRPAKPCPICEHVIADQYGIEHVIHS